MTDPLTSDARPVERPASAGLMYASAPVRPQTWRLVVGVAALAVGCGGLCATLIGVRHAPQWATTDGVARVATVLHYLVQFVGHLATALFGVALLCRSRQAWNAAAAYFGVQLVNPLAAALLLPFASAGIRSGSSVAYWLVSGYLSTAANGLGALLVVVLLTRPPVRHWVEHWSSGGVPVGDGAGERSHSAGR
jgi:hypothetical protein